MLTYTGGNPAKGGFYFHKGEWKIVAHDEENDTLLPGGIDAEYVKLPALMVVPAAIMLTLPGAVLLPFIGVAMFLATIATRWRKETA